MRRVLADEKVQLLPQHYWATGVRLDLVAISPRSFKQRFPVFCYGQFI